MIPFKPTPDRLLSHNRFTLIDKSKIETAETINKTDKVLVHGGAGGVGHLGAQLAKAFGADVYSTVSSDTKAEIVRNYGATPINYNSVSITEYVNEHTKGEGFDVIFDTVGGNVLNDSFEASKLEGRIT